MIAHGWMRLTLSCGLLLIWIMRPNLLPEKQHSPGSGAAIREKLS